MEAMEEEPPLRTGGREVQVYQYMLQKVDLEVGVPQETGHKLQIITVEVEVEVGTLEVVDVIQVHLNVLQGEEEVMA
jgi:hypothetical protein